MTKKTNKPLYIQIESYLIDLINTKKVLPNQKLPTEQELAELFGVSRITSKRTLVELERGGLIYRVRGSGSFVSPHKQKRNKDNKMVAMRFWLDEVRTVGGKVAGLWHPHTLAPDYGWADGFRALVEEMSM